MLPVLEDSLSMIGAALNDEKVPMKDRFRALFTLRNIGGTASVEAISKAFTDSSALLKHELAYCLGQMGNSDAIPILCQVLSDSKQEPMVRHEAGEALGAIGDLSALPVLEKHLHDPVIEVAETCQLAIERLRWVEDGGSLDKCSTPFKSVDPTPPSNELNVSKLEVSLLDETLPLYTRYCSMFSLRNINTVESALALTKGLSAKSALFRHEICFVLGQMAIENEKLVSQLSEVVENRCENEMVRHEAAEALGSIASEKAVDLLLKYKNDDVRVVRESCEVALDIADYQTSEDFQYANGLSKANSGKL